MPEKNEKTPINNLPEYAAKNPVDLCVEPTSRCNTKCAHCAHFYHNFGEDMSGEVFAKVAGALFKGAKTIDLVGTGEPFIAKSFPLFFEESQKKNLQISITSNGIALKDNEALIAKIVRSNAILRLSIDGAGKETFEFVRPFHKWENMINALEIVKKNADAAGREKKFRFVINFVVMKNNVNDIPEMVRLAAKYNAQEIQMLPLGDEDSLEKMKGQGLQHEPELLIKPLLRGLSLADKHKIKLTLPGFFTNIISEYYSKKSILHKLHAKILLLINKSINKPIASYLNYLKKIAAGGSRKNTGVKIPVITQLCMMPWKSTMIVANGDVYPCCQIFRPLGNLSRQQWSDIWNGPAYRKLRRTIHGWNPADICRYCHINCGINAGDEKNYDRFFSNFRKENIPITSDDVQFDSGFYNIEKQPDGSPGHIWMDKNSRLKVRTKPGAKFVRFLIIPYAPENLNHDGYVTINGSPKEYFDNSCADINFPVEHLNDTTLDIEFVMNQSHKPADDSRNLSLAIRGVEILY